MFGIKKEIKKKLEASNDLLSNINGYSLDLEQRLAVIDSSKSLLLIAGAGSGKSLTMIGKVMYLINQLNYKPDEILCITFTREACNNLMRNINKNNNYNVKVYTFHSLARLLLKDKNYSLAPNDLLEYVTDEYFYMIEYNSKFKFLVKKLIGKIDTPYKTILKSKELIALKKLIITFINLFKTNNYDIKYFLKIKTNKDLIRIIIDIYNLYEDELKSTSSLDYNDLIKEGILYIQNNSIPNYKYIIVDEYQDTSYIRYLLLKQIIDKNDCKIVCVGDDYQSIYRFSGCNLNMFLDFKKYFKKSKILKINNTYRNSQELINVAGKFIMKNKRQMYKKLTSSKHIDKPIKIMYSNSLYKLLDKVTVKYNNILILGRNNFDINKYFKTSIINYNGANIKYMTVHSSKGLEEDCVIIINLSDDILGFPNKIKDNKVLKYVNNSKDFYLYEEERRLFYVALTRSRNEVYLLVDKNNISPFAREIIKDNTKYIEYI
ncbi:MAG: UvrD-helicase domain-containing protein [bacterium]|nr:UvrD-helicase domain-containing protein [bacterium]